MKNASLPPDPGKSLQKMIIPSMMQAFLRLRSKERSLAALPIAQVDHDALHEPLKEAKHIDTTSLLQIVSDPDDFQPYVQHSISPALVPAAFAPKMIYIYGNICSACCWLRFRSLRLLVLRTMLQICGLTETLHGTNDPLPERIWAERRVLEIVDDSCSSHAYCFGYAETDEANIAEAMNKPSSLSAIPPDRIVLVWDLMDTFQLACTFTCVPLAKREWMEAHINAFRRRLETVA